MSLESRKHQHLHDVGYDTQTRYDLLLRSPKAGFRLADGAARALILNLKTNYLLLPESEAIGENFVEVYCKAGPSAHSIFTPRTFPADIKVFHEAAIYFGESVELNYGGGIQCAFYIEFRGCLFDELMGDFKRQLKQIINIQPKLAIRPHVELPPHREV